MGGVQNHVPSLWIQGWLMDFRCKLFWRYEEEREDELNPFDSSIELTSVCPCRMETDLRKERYILPKREGGGERLQEGKKKTKTLMPLKKDCPPKK